MCNRIVKEVIATLHLENGEVFLLSAGRRYCIARTDGRVEIEEKQVQVARLGTL